jgi:protein-tyrosine phosphatase
MSVGFPRRDIHPLDCVLQPSFASFTLTNTIISHAAVSRMVESPRKLRAGSQADISPKPADTTQRERALARKFTGEAIASAMRRVRATSSSPKRDTSDAASPASALRRSATILASSPQLFSIGPTRSTSFASPDIHGLGRPPMSASLRSPLNLPAPGSRFITATMGSPQLLALPRRPLRASPHYHGNGFSSAGLPMSPSASLHETAMPRLQLASSPCNHSSFFVDARAALPSSGRSTALMSPHLRLDSMSPSASLAGSRQNSARVFCGLTEVVHGVLHLGSHRDVCDLFAVRKYNIRAFLCVAAEVDPLPPFVLDEDVQSGAIAFKHVKLTDGPTTQLAEYIQEVFEFIDDQAAERRPVALFCQQGKSRSVSFAIAYLMREFKIDAAEALDLLQTAYPKAEPNFFFLSQLESISPLLPVMSRPRPSVLTSDDIDSSEMQMTYGSSQNPLGASSKSILAERSLDMLQLHQPSAPTPTVENAPQPADAPFFAGRQDDPPSNPSSSNNPPSNDPSSNASSNSQPPSPKAETVSVPPSPIVEADDDDEDGGLPAVSPETSPETSNEEKLPAARGTALEPVQGRPDEDTAPLVALVPDTFSSPACSPPHGASLHPTPSYLRPRSSDMDAPSFDSAASTPHLRHLG